MTSDCLKVLEVPESRFTEVIDHLRFNFFADEPLNRAVGLCRRGDSHFKLECHCLLTLKQGYSRIVVNEQGSIAAAVLNGVLKRGEREAAAKRLAEIEDKKFQTIFGLLYKVNEKIDLFSKYNVDELFECRILSVDEKYRGRGLANLLMANTVDIAKKNGFKVIKADATGLFSQKTLLKFGFKSEAEIPYSEIEETIRPSAPHEALKLMVKILD